MCPDPGGQASGARAAATRTGGHRRGPPVNGSDHRLHKPAPTLARHPSTGGQAQGRPRQRRRLRRSSPTGSRRARSTTRRSSPWPASSPTRSSGRCCGSPSSKGGKVDGPATKRLVEDIEQRFDHGARPRRGREEGAGQRGGFGGDPGGAVAPERGREDGALLHSFGGGCRARALRLARAPAGAPGERDLPRCHGPRGGQHARGWRCARSKAEKASRRAGRDQRTRSSTRSAPREVSSQQHDRRGAAMIAAGAGSRRGLARGRPRGAGVRREWS